ncbi:MAG: DNA repair protein RecO [Candidatus Omnitrophica bacterium]|nr:DNA repair protein RecO [Candidatus Omnitrophota bacterium]
MAAINTEGVILRKYLLRETSYILVIYTRDYGKIRAVFKGVRRPYPQFAGDLEIFTHCDISFYPKKQKDLDLITESRAKNSFVGARKDIERLTYANYIIELIDTVTGEHDRNEVLFELLTGGLELLGSDIPPKSAVRIFELKLLDALGLGPELGECVSCTSEINDAKCLDVPEGGVVCEVCSGTTAISHTVSQGTVNFFKKIRSVPISKAAGIKLGGSMEKEAERVLGDFVRFHVSDNIKSLEFARDLERKGIIR